MNASSHHPNDDATTPVLLGCGAKPAAQAPPEATRWLALGAVAGPVLGEFAWIVLGLLRPGYSPLRQQISDLGLGPTAPFMNAAFVLGGLLLLVGVVGIFRAIRGDVRTAARWICAVLLALSPLGVVVVGVFNETAVAGHVTGAILTFQTPVVSFLVTLVLVIVFLQTGPPGAPLAATGLGGLTERALIVEIHAWYMALGALAFRRASRSVSLCG
jgi:hypothetical membrane protein